MSPVTKGGQVRGGTGELRRSAARVATLTWIVVGMSACGGDATGPGGDLSQAEAGQLLVALSSVYLPNPSVPAPAPSRATPALAPTTTLRIDTTQVSVGCPAGGTALVINNDSISITVDVRLSPTPDTTFASDSEYGGHTSSTVRYSGCASPDGQGGVWTFDADPGLVLDFDLEGSLRQFGLSDGTNFSATESSWDGQWAGTLGWSNGGRSGQCAISMQMSSSTSVVGGHATSTFTQSGQVCGIQVSSSS